jgi:hypothetical protein
MARHLAYLVLGAILLTGCVNVQKETKLMTSDQASPAGATKLAKEPAQLLRHVVLLKFKDGTTAEQVREIVNAFCALPSKVDAIHDFEWGTNISVENLSQGFTHCFLVTFKSEADRAKYLPHPDHKEFGRILGPHLDKVLVVDYWAK